MGSFWSLRDSEEESKERSNLVMDGIVTLHRYILIYLSGMKTLLLMDLEKVERIAT
jgi:hypothetical protein